jgi:ATP-dependent RNA helicase RhlE
MLRRLAEKLLGKKEKKVEKSYVAKKTEADAPAQKSKSKPSSRKRPPRDSEPRAPRIEKTQEAEPKAPAKPLEGVFKDLLPQLQKAVAAKGYSQPTDIQAEAIPHLLKGRDVLGCAQTGTGKTAAFALPILQYLAERDTQAIPGRPQALVVTPTRELAQQVSDSFKDYGRYTELRHTVIYGGVSQVPQTKALDRGVHVVVATPGRLLDLISQKCLTLNNVGFFVMDEADRMLDMGFLPDLRKIVRALPKDRQSLLFSATLPDAILSLANSLVRDPISITITPDQPAVENIDQKMFFVDKTAKFPLLLQILEGEGKDRVIVFAQMKHVVSRIADELMKKGVAADAIHGDKSQIQRTRALDNFKSGKVRVLVATDVAARGIDIDAVSHVINFDLPVEAETYVHRIGRTARAGARGDAVSFCGRDEKEALRNIELLLGKDFTSKGANALAETAKDPAIMEKAKAAAKRFRGARR